jgi:hypothetical protein
VPTSANTLTASAASGERVRPAVGRGSGSGLARPHLRKAPAGAQQRAQQVVDRVGIELAAQPPAVGVRRADDHPRPVRRRRIVALAVAVVQPQQRAHRAQPLAATQRRREHDLLGHERAAV